MKKVKKVPFFKKYVNGTKGVISLFLAILMVPFTTIAGALINAGRINSAVAIFDEALCNASNSTLGTYDSFLRSRFGLMAISQDISDGGSSFKYADVNYSADTFVNELFTYYMEQNVGCLSNTYNEMEVSAAGLHPLSDPDILRDAVSQSSKIVVPAKLVVDWGSLDELVNKLKPPAIFSAITSMITSGSGVVADLDSMNEKQEALEKKIDALNTAKAEYDTAYTNFKNAASSFNTLVDNINSTTSAVNTYQQQVNNLSTEKQSVADQITEKQKELEKLEEASASQEEIDALQEELDELEEYESEVSSQYRTASENLSSAQSRLAQYKEEFPQKRNDVISKRDIYAEKILALRNAVNGASSAAVSYQNSITKLLNDGAGLVKDMISTGIEAANQSNKNQQKVLAEQDEYYKYQKTLAGYDDNTEEVTHYNNLLQENESARQNLQNSELNNKNINTIQGEAVNSMKTYTSEISTFAERDLTAEYRVIYDALEALRIKVSGITVPSGYTRMSYDGCYYSFKNPVEKADVKELIENLENEVENNSGWAVLKAAVSFIDAMLDIELLYDTSLTTEINSSLYSSVGGLPSHKSYPIISPYDSADAQKSLENKEMLNAYSSEAVYDTGGNQKTALQKIVDHFKEIKRMVAPFKWKNLPKLWVEVNGLKASIQELIAYLANSLWDAVTGKLLMVGYVTYNTANRTTYTGKALTGASFGLPGTNHNDGYVFSGAETEYIIVGSMNEKTNQSSVFWLLFATRILFNISPVTADATIQTLATTIGAATVGIGATLTFVVFVLVEAFVDTVVLANSGSIPIFKSFVYTMPTGIPKLLEEIVNLKLPEATKQTIYEGASKCAYGANEGIEKFGLEHGKYVETEVNLPGYPDYTSQQKQADKQLRNFFKLNYTQSLQLIMLLVCSTETMTKRLADIIQMEASYNAKKNTATYTFNLDKSYTYLRASGSFSSDLFIKVGDDSSLTSQQRVIYNGY